MIQFIRETLNYLSSLPYHLDQLFSQAGIIPYLILWINLFLETGGLIFNFLPGNSIVLASSAFSATSRNVQIEVLIPLFLSATLLGDITSFYLGRFFGRKYQKQHRFHFINQDHFEAAHDYFEENGRKTFIFSRFIPIFRGIMPFAAGFTQSEPSHIMPFLTAGVIFWNTVYISVGYFFGNLPGMKDNFSLLIGMIMLVTMIPTVILVSHGYKKLKASVQEKRQKRKPIHETPPNSTDTEE